MLSGTRRATPATWPARRVHRMIDDAPIAMPPTRTRAPLRRLQAPRPTQRQA
jgi:hypothetical protein